MLDHNTPTVVQREPRLSDACRLRFTGKLDGVVIQSIDGLEGESVI